MSDIYDINYAQQIIELLPPDKRYKNIVAWLTACCLSTLQFLRDALFGDYRNGSTVSGWVVGSYARGAKVNYKKGIYVSLTDGNTALPTDTVYWYLQQDFFIGLNERLMYNGDNLVLTYALNKWFGTTFRQPGNGISDIYITTNAIAANVFVVGADELECSAAGFDGSDQFVTNDYSFGTQYNAVINVPSAVYAALGPAAEALIRSFVDTYIYAGVTYVIVVY
jgi:hypothetical protein